MTEVPLRDAATVMLVRDTPVGERGTTATRSNGTGGDDSVLEVFMLRRNLQSDFVGGAYVFPGGGVDDHDRHADLEPICHGRTDAEASAQLGIERGGLAFWVAAIRESFEEAGVLLAYPPEGAEAGVIRLDSPEVVDRYAEHRRSVDTGERRLAEICADEHLTLAVDSMHYFSHWITPDGQHRRYDTRFFVGRAPEGQVPLHDDREVIANLWIRPVDALARHRAGEFEMIFPTIRTLQALERFASADDLLAAAAAIGDVPTILPRVVADQGGVRIVLPGDPGYDDLISAEMPADLPLTALSAQSGTGGSDAAS